MRYIDNKELKIIAMVTGFGLVWMLLVTEILATSTWFKSLIPPIQFFIYNLGFITVNIIIFGTILSKIKKKTSTVNKITNGLISFIIYTFIFDIWTAPRAWTFTGIGLVDTGDGLLAVAPDYMTGWVFMELGLSIDKMFGIFPISSVYISTYVFTPILSILIVSLLFSPKATMRFLKG